MITKITEEVQVLIRELEMKKELAKEWSIDLFV